MSDLPAIIDYPHGVSAVDTGYTRPQMTASHLLVEQGRAAFVDTGPNSAVPALLAALEQHELTPDAVGLGLTATLPAMLETGGQIGEFGRGERI